MTGERNQRQSPDPFEAANAWFHRLNGEDATPAEREAFARWLAADTAHAEAWDELQALTLAIREPARAVSQALRRQGMPAPARRPRRGRRLFGQGAMAAIALILVIGGYREVPVYWSRLNADYATGIGKQRQVTLADGTHVELNTDTALSVDLSGGRHQVTLLRGEAWFDVHHDAQHPFTVRAGSGETTDVGTRFGVMLGADGTATVTVAEGLVDVTKDGASLRLGAGSAVDYGAGGLSAVHQADPSIVFAWRHGRIVFRQQPLSEVVAALNRYRPGPIMIMSRKVAEQIVSGSLEIDQPVSSVEALESTFGIKGVSVGSYLTLLY